MVSAAAPMIVTEELPRLRKSFWKIAVLTDQRFAGHHLKEAAEVQRTGRMAGIFSSGFSCNFCRSPYDVVESNASMRSCGRNIVCFVSPSVS